jgi:hypothetical protein
MKDDNGFKEWHSGMILTMARCVYRMDATGSKMSFIMSVGTACIGASVEILPGCHSEGQVGTVTEYRYIPFP